MLYKKKYCFIILHYQTIEETEDCIASIKKLSAQEDIQIIIIDNASSNKSGEILLNKYINDPSVDVILNGMNEGFSRANNKACDYARENYNPDFYIVANNDIEFEQTEFCELIENEYQANKFGVLGPDIYNTRQNVHQSPLQNISFDINDIRKTIYLNKIMLQFYDILYPFFKCYINKVENHVTNGKDFDKYQKNVCLMGACMIFSADYVKEREKVFYPETFFYYEEALVALWCRKNGKLMVYNPQITVKHKEGASTDSMSNIKEKYKFRITNILNSSITYINELKKE